MKTNRILCMILATTAVCEVALAKKVVLEDFESYEVGQELQMWNRYGLQHSSRCVVELDPANSNNKVLHVYLNDWNTYFPITLPEELAGTAWHATQDFIDVQVRRSSADVNDNKKFFITQDNVNLWSDGDDSSYPHQGNKNVWQSRSYALDKEVTSASNQLALGMHSDKSDYYMDNIVFRGRYDNYVLVGDDKFDFSGQNSASEYKKFDTPLNVPYSASATIYTARYSYFNSPVMGEGIINIYSGGERTFLGNSDKSYPDWKMFRGDVHVYPYKSLSSANGFYGLVLMHNGKVITPEKAQEDADDGKMNTCLTHSTLVLHDGATLAIEGSDKNRGARIGRLQMEEGSSLMGYYKSKDAANSYYLIGGTNDDALLAGRIAPASDNKKMLLGLIKEGTGTYRITGNRNLISGGVRVVQGRVLFNNDAALAKSSKLSGSLGTPASATTSGLVVLQQGTAGGTGHIAAGVNLYGILQPGDDGIGQLAIADYASAKDLTLIVRPSARLEFQITSAEKYDRLDVQGPVSYYNIMQDYSESDMMPRLRIQLTADAKLNVDDEFVLFSANGKAAYNNVEWQFDVRYPKAYTWAVEQHTLADGTFRVVARVTSLDYNGQGEAEDSDVMPGDATTDDGTYDLAVEQRETSTTLRSFADAMGQYIGICVPVWKLNVDNDNDVRTRLIAGQFNAVVCENEMKFDATEPNRGQFSFGSGDQLIALANRHNLYVRGHALAWHSQVPGWLTSDGTKNSNNLSRTELLAILKNHIFNVVGHWKGKIREWDVANEVLDDNQTSINSNPKAYDLRPSVWATGIGEDFLDSAFVWAHQADPDARLILNDYDVEAKGKGKSEALYNLAMRLKNSGIPIDGVGLQCHLDAGFDFVNKIEQNIARYQQAGLLCHITELDLGIDNNSAAALAQQGEDYYRLARIAMKYDNCQMLMIWGLADDLTWRSGRRPLLYDAANQPKPAYWGVHAALRQAAGAELTTIETVREALAKNTGTTATAIFNLQGQRVTNPRPGQFYLQGSCKFIMHR